MQKWRRMLSNALLLLYIYHSSCSLHVRYPSDLVCSTDRKEGCESGHILDEPDIREHRIQGVRVYLWPGVHKLSSSHTQGMYIRTSGPDCAGPRQG